MELKGKRNVREIPSSSLSQLTDRRGPILTWTNLSSVPKSIGILDDDISPIPPIEGIQFLSASYLSSSKQLLETLQLASCVHAIQIIRDYIVPAWESGQATNWASTCKDLVSAFILGHFSSFSLDLQSKLRTLPIIPVAQLNGKETSKFALAEELIDPSVPELRELCFDDEEIIPKAKFLRDFNFALKGCGLKTAVDEAVVEHRIRHYANSKYPLLDIKEHAQKLLKCNFRWASPLNKESGSSNLRRLRWLPAIDLEGTLELKNPTECRGCGDCSLVSSQLPVLGISISAEWEARLGWSGILPSQILLSQLAYGVNNKHRKIVDAVLTYFSQHGLTKSVAAKLMSISCVLASSGMYMRPSQAFRPAQAFIPDCDRLQPYLANIDIKFWEDHEDLLGVLEIGDSPQLTDLLKIQVILEGKPILEEDDRAVAIEILKLASRFPRASLTGLKVIDATGKLCPIYDISSDDLGPLKPKQKFNIAHPDIPFTTIKKLGIESLRERLIKGMLEIEDVDDEDEFDQRESVTSRIADTLDRYPVETTFREYLANADDTEGASKISWLLDGRTHSCDNLLTPEMKAFQGPAFLVHNDGGRHHLIL
jgi:sacsin